MTVDVTDSLSETYFYYSINEKEKNMKEVRCVFMFAVLTLWMALPVGAQNAKRGITMSLVNESLASALRKVQQESDYKVSFVIEDVKSYTTTVHLKNASASTAVKQILQGKPFTYSVTGKFITVKKVSQHKTAQIMELPSAPSQEQLPMRMENL